MIKAIKNLIALHEDKKKHYISVYGIFADAPILTKEGKISNKNIVPVSFAKNYEQAAAVVERLLYYKYFPHFSSWITYSKKFKHTKPSMQSECWYEYKTTVLADMAANDYHILKLTYSNDEFASLLRIFSGCAPLYMPHETPTELVEYMKDHCDEDGKIILPKDVSQAMQGDAAINSAVQKAYDAAAALAESEAKKQ